MALRYGGCDEWAGNVFVLTCWSFALRGDFALGPGRAMLTVISWKGSLVPFLPRFTNHSFSFSYHPYFYLVNNHNKTIALK